ncbi:STAS domain-containing protein [Amycolatopsis umgeniensis]|uniref:Anti-sigma factor antagonist n=1 Tax=Amycolatopsis umgeniensis TaxID=336628 RepID=A0A841AYZ4_9PSEU|nr:STAS domain-containing protein [Amycolatopsis umgeniensis]MBB5851318.1 anti-anti-sigma factor [Amycolatopsis umgeniensis]
MERMWLPGLVPGAAVQAWCSHGDPAVIALTGELDSYTFVVVETAVAATLVRNRGKRAIVLDLAEVTFLSATGIRALHDAVDQAAARGVTLRFALGSHAIVRRALNATGMAAVLDLYPDRLAALDAADSLAFLGLIQSL